MGGQLTLAIDIDTYKMKSEFEFRRSLRLWGLCGGEAEGSEVVRVGEVCHMGVRRSYNTRQRQAVVSFLAAHADRYLSVDDVFGLMRTEGSAVGRTTAYRTLESLAKEGEVAKACVPGGGEARYRLIDPTHRDEGQLVCLSCGKVLSLDCGMLIEFKRHVQADHGFSIDPTRTVLYGLCRKCMT